MSAGVMMANVIWKAKNSTSGRVPVRLSALTPVRKALDSPPHSAPPGPKAME